MSQMPPPVPPTPLSYAQPPAAGIDLRGLAFNQRVLNLCILGYIGLIFARFALPPEAVLIAAVATLAVIVIAAICVFRMALVLYGTGMGIVLGLLSLIPLIGLIPLLIINSRATNVLRQHGYIVGLLGASPNQTPR